MKKNLKIAGLSFAALLFFLPNTVVTVGSSGQHYQESASSDEGEEEPFLKIHNNTGYNILVADTQSKVEEDGTIDVQEPLELNNGEESGFDQNEVPIAFVLQDLTGQYEQVCVPIGSQINFAQGDQITLTVVDNKFRVTFTDGSYCETEELNFQLVE